MVKRESNTHALVTLGNALDAADKCGCAEVDAVFAGVEDVADIVVGIALGVVEA